MLAAAVRHRASARGPGVEPERGQDVRKRRLDRAERTVDDLERNPEAVGRRGTEKPLRAALGNPAVQGADHKGVRRDGTAQKVRMRAHRANNALAPLERSEPREGVRCALERQREGRNAATVHADHERGRRHLGRVRDLAQHRLLARVPEQPVAGRRPVPRATQREKAGVFPGAVVLDRGRCRPALELALGRGRVGEDAAHYGELLGRGEMRRADERDLLVVEVRPRPHHGERLDRLRGRPEIRDQRGIPRRELDPAVPDGNGVDHVPRLDDLAAGDVDDDRLHGGEPR